MGRNTQGVRLIRLDDNDKLVGIEWVEKVVEEAGSDQPQPT
jgi:hypothetical protein